MITPLISIIIPVYKAGVYLHRCLDSIKQQTFTDWECILVDDGSPDNSGIICDDYAAKDCRFRVFHKENGGVSSARNLGLENAKGEWVFFSDADDELLPNALQILNSYKSDAIDLVMAGHERVNEKGELLDNRPALIHELISNSDAVARMYVFPNFDYEGYLWDKLFRRKVIVENHLLFDSRISFKEDSLYCMLFILASGRDVFYTTEIVYRYYLNETSAMAVTRNGGYNKKHWTSLDAHIIQYTALKKKYPNHPILKDAQSLMFGNYQYNKILMINAGELDKKLLIDYQKRVFSVIDRSCKLRFILRASIPGRAINKILRILKIKYQI